MSDQEIFDEELLQREDIHALTQQEKFERLHGYRKEIQSGKMLSENAYRNAIAILQASRSRVFLDAGKKPEKRAAKKAAETTEALSSMKDFDAL